MSDELKYPAWQELLREALIEFDPQEMRAKIQKANTAVQHRLLALRFDSGHQDELRELSDAMSTLRILRRDKSLVSYRAGHPQEG
jgi:hypothetical protein